MSADSPEKSEITTSRRSFLDGLLAVGGGIWALGMAGPAAAYLWPAQSKGPGQSTVNVGPVKDLPVGEARLVQGRGHPILVIRRTETEFTALSAICTHLGCIVQWDPAQALIVCPCHAAVFAPDGGVVSGPPPRPLAQYPVMVIGDEVHVKLI